MYHQPQALYNTIGKRVTYVGTDCFPLLRTDNLTAYEREMLIADLVYQSEAIHRSFAVLVSNVERDLERSGISTSNLQLFFEASGLEECITSTDTISEAMIKMTKRKYWTFFNYELLESTVHAFCKSTNITGLLSLYITEFKEYCQRRLCEVPASAMNINIPHSISSQAFCVKLDEHFSSTYVSNIKKVQTRLSKMLRITIVNLITVAEGCVELTFRVYSKGVYIAQKLATITEYELANMNISWIQCGAVRFQIGTSASGGIPTVSGLKGELIKAYCLTPYCVNCTTLTP